MHCPCDAHALHVACVSVPQLTVVVGGGTGGLLTGAAVAGVIRTGAAVAGVIAALGDEPHEGLHDRAQFCSIHTRASPLHCPCDAQVAHVACVSVPQLRVVVGGGTAGLRTGAAVVGGIHTGAAVAGVIAALGDEPHEGLQLRAQFWSIHACEELLQSPCDAHALHVACVSVPQATVPAAGEGWAGGVTRGPAVGGTKVGCAPEFGGDPALALVPAIVIPGAAYLPDAERVSEPRWI